MTFKFENYNPKTLEEAVDILYTNLTEAEKAHIKGLDTMVAFHHGVGRNMRNGWGLWKEDSPLGKYFAKVYKITHADDISSMILEGVLAKAKQEEYNPYAVAKKFLDYWKNININNT